MKSIVFIFPLLFLCLSAQELKFTLAIHSGAIDDERAKFSKELEEEYKRQIEFFKAEEKKAKEE